MRLRKELAYSLQFRIIHAADDLKKIRLHLSESLAVNENNEITVSELEYCVRVLELLGIDETKLEVVPEELRILHKNKHDHLVAQIVNLIRTRNIMVRMIEKYNRMKAEIDSDLVQVGEFEIEDGKVILKIGFSPKENPILMGKIHKANALIREIFEITTGVCETIDNVFQDINLAFPEYFPKEMKPKKIGEMKQGAKDDISDNEK